MWGQFVPDADTEYTLECCATDHDGFIGYSNEALDGRSSRGARFKFEEATDGCYYIKVVDAGKYFKWDNGDASLSDTHETMWEITPSAYIDGKYRIAPNGAAANEGLNNNENSKSSHLKIGPFTSAINACSHWTIRGIKTPIGYNRYIGGITTGSSSVDATKWKTENNWVLASGENSWNIGPGYTNSNLWYPIYLQDVTATGIEFEGWNLRLKLVNSSLTATTVKLQTGVASTIDVDENSTLSLTLSTTNNGQWTRTFNIDGSLTINMGTQSWSTGTNANTINLGTTGRFTLAANSEKTTPAASSFTINATLTDPTEHNTVESRTLATFTNVTVTTLSNSISGTDGWTSVANKAALETQSDDGKYYYVESSTSSGVTLHKYQKFSTYEVAASTTETLSEITDYNKFSCFTVPSGSTLIVDVADFDLTKISGAGTVVLDADVTFSGNKSTVATGKLTINEGKTLTIGGGDSETNSIESFTSIDLAGTISHNNITATLNNVTVPTGKTGKIFAFDMGEDEDGFKLAGTTTLTGNLTVCSKWNFQMKIDVLAGSGTWLICGTTSGSFDASGSESNQSAVINVASASSYTGNVTVNNSKATINLSGNLIASSWTRTKGTLTYTGTSLNGTTLDGVILGGSERLGLSNTVTIKNLAGNNQTAGSNDYVIATNNAANLILEGDCDFTHKSNSSESTFCHIAIGNTSGSITVKSGANVSCGKIWYGDNKTNAPITVESSATLTSSGAINASTITNNGTISATGRLYANTINNNGTIVALKFDANVVLGDGSATTLSATTPFNDGTVTVSGDATLNLTAATTTALTQNINVADGKTLTIDGGESLARVSLTGSVTGDINIENATIEGGTTRNYSSLPYADYDNCTLVVSETTAEFNTDDETINITNIPSYFTTIKLRRADRKYVTLDVTEGTATFTDSEAKVSGPKCLYDFTFSLETLDERKAENSSQILNSGSRGSSNGLNYDTGYNSGNSYNEETGLLKVKSTPWRDMTGGNAWPTNYSVAVYANVPDVENGCLMAFGSSTNGGNKYLALVRGASSNEIKLVKGDGMNNAFEVIATMSAENATVARHLVVFTKSGSTFKVYCDGVNVATTTYDQTLGTGFQIGSVHGGVTGTGIIRVNDTENVSAEVRDAVEVQAIRIFDGVLDDDQMSALQAEFPYVSKGGAYSRTISTDANLGVDGAWTHGETTAHIPTSVTEDEATYYPDVTITTSADATLTVNEDATFGKTSFGGSGILTIDTDASGHSINVVGAVIVNSDVIVKFGAIDISTSPLTKGADATLTFDFSDYDFSGVYDETEYVVTGNTDDYGSKVTAVYPSDTDYHTYSLDYNSTTSQYVLTVAPKLALKQQQAIALVQPYYDGNYVGAGIGKYTISLGETSYANFADFRTAVMSWEEVADYVEPTIAINQPTSAFYRIKSDDKYLQDLRKSNEATQRTLTDASGANEAAETIFYLDDDTFVGYKTGYGFGFSVCQTRDTEHLNTQLFTESAEMGKYTIQSQKGTYSSDTDNVGYWGVDGSDLSRENDIANSACWTVEEVSSLPITFNAEYASFYSPVDLTIPDNSDLKVYTGTLNGGYLHLDEVEGTLPANTGVILHLDNWSERTVINFPVLSTITSGSSDLTGTVATQTVEVNTKLVLGYVDDTWGIYSFNNTTLNGFKAYMNMPSTPVKGFTFDLDDAVGIRSIDNGLLTKDNDKVIYNLSGQRINKLQRGVNIVNGKKVIIK